MILKQAVTIVVEISQVVHQVQIGKQEVGIKVKETGIIKPGEVKVGIKAIGIKVKISGSMVVEIVKIMEIMVAGAHTMVNMLKVGVLR